jgi:lambda family phage tail tape measure protein
MPLRSSSVLTTITDSLGALQTAWRAAGQYASEAWDSMLNIGKTETVGQKIAAISKQIDDARSGTSDLDAFNNGSALGSSPGRIDALKLQQALLQEDQRTQNRGADRSAQTTAEEQGKITAISWLDGFHNQFASQAAKRKKEIDEYLSYANRAGVSPAQQTTDIAAINEKYKDKAPKKVTDDEGTKMLQRLRDQDAATQAALTSNDKLTDAEKQQAAFLQQIADLKNKSILTADQKSLLARQDDIKAQLQQNVNDEKALKTKQDIQKVLERSAQLNTQIADYQQNQQEGYQRTLGAIGLGTDAQQQVDATRSIYKEYQTLQAQLTKATPKDALGSAEYLQAVASIKSGLDKSLSDYSDYYAQLKAKQGDWTNGAAESWANYRDAAANVMDQTKGLFDDVFSGMETSIQNFEATGKLSFTALANSIITDLERIAAKAAVTAIVGELGSVASQYLPSLIGGATGGVGTGVASAVANVAGGDDKIGALYGLTNGFAQYKATGGLLNGPGTGTSDSIPVMASDGEFIVKQSVVAKPGVLAMLNALNGGQSVAGQSHFATGGYVGSQASTPAGSVVSSGDIHITLPASQAGPQSGYNKDDAAQLKKLVQGFVDDRLSRQMRGQGGFAYNLKNGYV